MATTRTLERASFNVPNATMQRFDARHWSINYPYSAVATIIATTADTFTVHINYRSNRDLIGVIWDSEDVKGHNLLKYVNDRNYSGTVLAFVANPPRPYDFPATIATQDGSFVYRLYPYKNVSGTLSCDVVDPISQGVGTGRTYPISSVFPSGLSSVPSGYQIYIIDFDDLRRGYNYDEGAISNGGITQLFLSLVPDGYNLGKDAYLLSTGGVFTNTVTMQGVTPTLKITDGDTMVIGETVVTITANSGFGSTTRTLTISPGISLGVNTKVYSKALANDSPLGNETYEFVLRDMNVTGSRTTIERYYYPQPAHDLKMTTGFDDTYNITPWKQVMQTYELGYRGQVVMYMGASHYYKSTSYYNGSNQYTQTCNVGETEPINGPTVAFCESFFSELHAKGMQFIWSTSLEILSAHMPDAWAQKDVDDLIGESGWVPHTAFIRPTSVEGTTHIINVVKQGMSMMAAAGLDLYFQLGEFWWWDGSYSNGKPCIYDYGTKLAYNAETGLFAPTTITNIYQPTLNAAELAYCQWLGDKLGQLSVDVQSAIKATYPTAQSTLLFFTPQIFYEASIILPIINFPTTYWSYASGNWDFMQIEDYDWIINKDYDLLPRTRAAAVNILGFPLDKVHYFVGFVLYAYDQYIWEGCGRALTESMDAGVEHNYVWAYTQVMRDSIVYKTKEDVVYFREEVFPELYSYHVVEVPEFKSTVIEMPESGRESRALVRSSSRSKFILQSRDIRDQAGSSAHYNILKNFFLCVAKGDVYGFRLLNKADYQLTNEVIATADGVQLTFQVIKTYSSGAYSYVKQIKKIISGTASVYVDTGSGPVLQTTGYTINLNTGVITFSVAPADNAIISVTLQYHWTVRFSEKVMPFTLDPDFGLRGLDSVEMLEVFP